MKNSNTVDKNKDIDDMIKSITYTLLPSGKTTVCEITLKNDFVLIGTSSCVDVNNYDKEIGNKLSRENALLKLRELAAYELSSEIMHIPLPLSTKKNKDKEIN